MIMIYAKEIEILQNILLCLISSKKKHQIYKVLHFQHLFSKIQSSLIYLVTHEENVEKTLIHAQDGNATSYLHLYHT